MLFQFFGLLSAVVFIAADMPYLIDTWNKKITPHRVSWAVFFTLNCIAFANQLASGARNSLWVMGSAALMTGLIAAASLRHGTGGHSKIDHFAILASIAGIFLWLIFDNPLISVVITVLVFMVAFIPTLIKAREDPSSETRITWFLATVSSVFAFISVGKLDIALLLLPLNGFVLQGIMSYILYKEDVKSYLQKLRSK